MIPRFLTLLFVHHNHSLCLSPICWSSTSPCGATKTFFAVIRGKFDSLSAALIVSAWLAGGAHLALGQACAVPFCCCDCSVVL